MFSYEHVQMGYAGFSAFLWSGFLKQGTEYCSLIDSWKHEKLMPAEKKIYTKNSEKYIMSWISVVFLNVLGDV